mmetsp:Transcript_1783/g.3558  ORF Transcript_1783/g.3558 Transcript_1783/m.3558 type:complete len:733 (+) Transcript_1783:3-2201(+)
MGCQASSVGAAQKTLSPVALAPDAWQGNGGESGAAGAPEERDVMQGMYRISSRAEDMMGEGTSSICYKGTNLKTNEQVAVKVYKMHKKKGGRVPSDVLMTKFVRQIEVLKELMEPLPPQSEMDPRFWCARLADTKPSRVFMQLLDYSKDTSGNPGPDPDDGMLYVVTELAQYSLKDYLSLRREQNKPIPASSVKNISKAMILVTACLHAKGLVHIDMKPENLMMFNGRLKLIDVDGCMKRGSKVSIEDSSISFSPCYCSPEWAKFLIEDHPIVIDPALDCWSVGMTICELITLDAILKPVYANFLRNGHSHREAAFLFMEWLSSIDKAPLSKPVRNWDAQAVDALVNGLLIIDPKKRKTCAEVLQMEFICGSEKETQAAEAAEASVQPKHAETGPSAATSGSAEDQLAGALVPEEAEIEVQRKPRMRPEDTSSKATFKGVLWKLNSDGNPQDPKHWLKRDMWITDNGALSYWSMKETKRLVLIGGDRLAGARIGKFLDGAMPHAMEVQTGQSQEAEEQTSITLAAESEEEYNTWMEKLRNTSSLDVVMDGFRLGQDMADQAKAFRKVRNRRLRLHKIDEKSSNFEPVFKATLWKLKADGNRLKEADWFEREMWLGKNGCLVYWSKRDEQELVYYTAQDIERADITHIPDGESWRPFSFEVELAPLVGQGDVHFAAGLFAAESLEMRDKWISELLKCKRQIQLLTRGSTQDLEARSPSGNNMEGVQSPPGSTG